METITQLKRLKTAFTAVALLAIVCVIPNCKKKTLEYTIVGTVNDLSFNNKLAGAKVELKLLNSGNSSGNKTFTVTTDASGTFSFTFERDKFTSIELSVEKNLYFSTLKNLTLDQLEVNGTTTVDFNMNAMAWVRLHFTGNGTKDIKYYKQQGLNGCADCCPAEEQTLQLVSDENILCINNGNALYQIYYMVLDTTDLNGQVDVITTPFDTVDLHAGF